jgi:hypothetical protein
VPLHPDQHAYQAGKSVETALHQLVVRVQKALEEQETALDVFLDIEGAFTNTPYDSMCAVLLKMGLTTPSYVGLELPWRAAWLRRLSVDLPRSCPQGGALSPLPLSLVVDFTARLNGDGIYTQGYADDICFLAVGKFPNTVDTWCDEVGCR